MQVFLGLFLIKIQDANTCEAIKEEAGGSTIRRTNKVAVAKEGAVTFIKGDGGEIESCAGNYTRKGEKEEKEIERFRERPTA